MNKSSIASFFLLVIIYSCNFGAGSYPYAKVYNIDLSESEIIERIELFKKSYPSYSSNKFGFKDGRRNVSDYWYHIYFNDSINKRIIKTWVRKKNKETTMFALIGIKEYSNLEKWKFVNSDLKSKENKEVIKKFEEEILNHLEVNY